MSACADPNCAYHHPGRPAPKCEGCGGNVARILCHKCITEAKVAAAEVGPNLKLAAEVAALKKDRDAWKNRADALYELEVIHRARLAEAEGLLKQVKLHGPIVPIQVAADITAFLRETKD
jgi:hypothetical protein